VLVELNVVEQRYQAVLEVLNDGASVTDVARRYGVARQTVHEWLGASRPIVVLVHHVLEPQCPVNQCHRDHANSARGDAKHRADAELRWVATS